MDKNVENLRDILKPNGNGTMDLVWGPALEFNDRKSSMDYNDYKPDKPIRKILVTGAAGYIGSTLVPMLREAGYEVTAVDNFLYGQTSVADKVGDIHLGDVNLPNELMVRSLEEADCVIHLAAIVGAPACDFDPELARKTNLESLQNIVNVLRRDQLLIFPNTNSGYGKAGDEVCTEETPMKSLSLYGTLKESAEEYALRHKKTVVFRFATVFGVSPRMRLDLLVNQLTYDAYFNKRIELFDGDFRRNYLHVKDACAGIMYAIENKKCHGEVFNLGNDAANTTKMGLVEEIDQHLLFQLSTKEQDDPDQRDYEVSSAKFTKAGFTASVSLSQGIEELIEFYKTLPEDKVERLDRTMYMRNA